MVFEFSWQIGAGENSHIPVKSSTIHSPSNDTIFVSGNDEPRFSNCVQVLSGLWPKNFLITSILSKHGVTQTPIRSCRSFGKTSREKTLPLTFRRRGPWFCRGARRRSRGTAASRRAGRWGGLERAKRKRVEWRMGRGKVVTWVTANEMETRLIVATGQGHQLWHGCRYDGKGRRNNTLCLRIQRMNGGYVPGFQVK